MTTHKLTTHGSRRTRCGLGVPSIIEVKPTATTWDDGDGPRTGICVDCHPLPVGIEAPLVTHSPPASSPRPASLQRFNAMQAGVKVGEAVVNRDGTLAVRITVPVIGKLALVPT